MAEADIDYSGAPDPGVFDVDGVDFTMMVDALFISLNPLGVCPWKAHMWLCPICVHVKPKQTKRDKTKQKKTKRPK
jgi:hypothetical protein